MKKIKISQFSHNRPGDMNYRKSSEQRGTSGQRRVKRLHARVQQLVADVQAIVVAEEKAVID